MFIVFRSSPGGGVLHGRDLRHERVKKVYQCTHTIPQLLFNDFVIAIKHHFYGAENNKMIRQDN